ncbi:hypothetical protein MJO28_013827 [Puccinia striiformis f. sp. tritici]|uniref:Vacuolar sorting protein Vps3844 C-terminal domain-containing protein n=2 Tax=Puccinia striiformis TaxID=27350 RepID=A0A2S4UYG9_9BASI|nr:hypothetical protein Pst134EB_026271 [Puccinia striiformis f. sp. tritici]KAI7940175.1 hypothetical protein MJO28_013827 [Puccinia striiformis f. sp. tritici]KAI7941592.1 hypothetical protein MJO29_013666 [Puccinia striiformis f. sp. tritici]POW02318.1 hypothetical protein PSTT_11896 [Puccinia striiformis]
MAARVVTCPAPTPSDDQEKENHRRTEQQPTTTTMLLTSLLLSAALLLANLTNGQLSATIYLNQKEDSNSEQQLSLSTSELNAILSHRLNISQFESLPTSLNPTTSKYEAILGNPHSNLPIFEDSASSRKRNQLFIALYGNDGQTVLPEEFVNRSQKFKIPNPPDTLSFDALISIYIGRIVDSLRVTIDSIGGVKDFIQAYHDGMGLEISNVNILEWAADWADSIPDWINWLQKLSSGKIDEYSKLVIQSDDDIPEIKFGKMIQEYGTLDAAAYQIIEDLKTLDEYKIRSTEQPITFMRLSGLQQVRRKHGESSIQYRTSESAMRELFKKMLITDQVESSDSITVIGIPAQPIHSRLDKRTNLSILSPFKTSESSFIKRELIERRRSIFGTNQLHGIPIIPSSRPCFTTQTECKSKTSSCNGNGECVQGQKTSGGKCFVCSCSKSADSKTGKVVYWSGDSCQKRDISSGFVLLSGTAFILIIFFAIAVKLLISVGSENLPQQLASINGHSKKID